MAVSPDPPRTKTYTVPVAVKSSIWLLDQIRPEPALFRYIWLRGYHPQLSLLACRVLWYGLFRVRLALATCNAFPNNSCLTYCHMYIIDETCLHLSIKSFGLYYRRVYMFVFTFWANVFSACLMIDHGTVLIPTIKPY